MTNPNNKVEQFIQGIFLVDPEKTQQIKMVRKLILESRKDILEDIKYGVLFF